MKYARETDPDRPQRRARGVDHQVHAGRTRWIPATHEGVSRIAEHRVAREHLIAARQRPRRIAGAAVRASSAPCARPSSRSASPTIPPTVAAIQRDEQHLGDVQPMTGGEHRLPRSAPARRGREPRPSSRPPPRPGPRSRSAARGSGGAPHVASPEQRRSNSMTAAPSRTCDRRSTSSIVAHRSRPRSTLDRATRGSLAQLANAARSTARAGFRSR